MAHKKDFLFKFMNDFVIEPFSYMNYLVYKMKSFQRDEFRHEKCFERRAFIKILPQSDASDYTSMMFVRKPSKEQLKTWKCVYNITNVLLLIF